LKTKGIMPTPGLSTVSFSGCAVAGLLLALTACSGESDDTAAVDDHNAKSSVSKEIREAGQDLHRAGEAASETVQARAKELADELGETREDFRERSQQRLREVDRELDELDARAQTRGRTLSRELRQARRELDQSREAAADASQDAWDEARSRFARGLAELEEKIHNARKDLESKT
jgi:hypothetical protein